MTVAGFLRFCAGVRGYRRRRTPPTGSTTRCGLTTLESVRLQPVETLSKGFKRRVGLAQALLHDPPVLVLDEPTDGLDPNQKHEVRALIGQMAPTKAIVISTHILEEVDAVVHPRHHHRPRPRGCRRPRPANWKSASVRPAGGSIPPI